MKRMLTLILLLLGTVRVAGQAQETVNVTAIELVAEVKTRDGQVPADLTPADFTVLEDGVERKVIGVDYLAPRAAARPVEVVAAETQAPQPAAAPAPTWHFLFYFESELSSAQGRRLVADALSREIDRYVRLGTVDVVLANPRPVALVQGSRDPKAITAALEKVKAQGGINRLQLNRRRFRDSMAGRPTIPDVNDIRPFLDDDVRLVTLFRKNLAQWLSGYRRHSPRMAIVVTDGFDLEPVNFYAMEAAPRNPILQAELRSVVSGSEVGTGTSQLAKELAGGSWIISSVPGQMDMGMIVDDASSSGIGRVKGVAATPQVGSKALVNLPMAPLMVLAEATGGTVIGNHSKVGEAMDQLSRYVRITYQVGRVPDGKIRKVEVRTRRRGLEVRAQQWVSATTPEDTSEARAVALLGGTEYAGQELPTEATLTLDSSSGRTIGTIEISADLDVLSALIEDGVQRNFRVTVAMRQGTNVRYFTRMVRSTGLSDGVLRYRLGIELPEPVSKMIVTVEDLATGAWGSALVEPAHQDNAT